MKSKHSLTLRTPIVFTLNTGHSTLDSSPPSPLWLAPYPLADGQVVRFRHVTPEDAELIAEAIRTSSPETLLHRFFSPVRGVPLPVLRQLLLIDGSRDVCVVGLIDEQQVERTICGARFVRAEVPETAEIAITVHDQFQRRGLGTYLLQQLVELARPVGIERFEGFILPSNVGMLRLIDKFAPGHTRQLLGDVVRVVIELKQIPK
ncbi:GNAT family N-acetyltransferase [Planctomicrobium piriforme]|uniref:Acetyltransferase n=1 Tax=Planctomicrobium piriforme TaxID=1576369 RepID=A0A1I3HF77_9PLAN|nr:GNAT family N-acetyltransferase [Planctomicrobium piriforme]SFI34395.1 acetyltransferase [Planctomicrobium piriforme]